VAKPPGLTSEELEKLKRKTRNLPTRSNVGVGQGLDINLLFCGARELPPAWRHGIALVPDRGVLGFFERGVVNSPARFSISTIAGSRRWELEVFQSGPFITPSAGMSHWQAGKASTR